MKIKLTTRTLIFTLLIIGTSSFAQTKNIVGQHFKYQGEPIHPKLVKEFTPWVSDEKPITTSVDIAAAFKSNEYYASVISDKSGHVSFEDEDDSFSYIWLGKLDNEVHVVRTFDKMIGGSGIFQDLLFIKFNTQEFDLNGETYEQTIMTLVKSYKLGDRTHPEIKILSDSVIINTPLDHDKKVVVKF